MKRILAFLRSQRAEVAQLPLAEDAAYTAGYMCALDDLEEYILDQMWEEGEDDDEA